VEEAFSTLLEIQAKDQFGNPACLRTANGAETRAGYGTVWIIELRVIPRIEEFSAELQFKTFSQQEVPLQG
jgi:hypothetical protein